MYVGELFNEDKSVEVIREDAEAMFEQMGGVYSRDEIDAALERAGLIKGAVVFQDCRLVHALSERAAYM